MSFLYLTADQIGSATGGGAVTFNEREALRCLGDVRTISRDELWAVDGVALAEPWKWDSLAYSMVGRGVKLAHIYSGTFSSTVRKLKDLGAKVVYTIAAHRVADSKRAFEDIGLPYNFPHLTEPALWRRYSAGYFAADVIVCPSTHSADVVREQAADLHINCPRIEVIPHGCHLPAKLQSSPNKNFYRVGYCGAYGPDKGIRYLLEAWRELNYRDACLLLAGRESTGSFVGNLIRAYGGGNIQLAGWQTSMENFYAGLDLYVQPSATEGFGLEVLEAMANGRPVLCSDHAGARDLVPGECVFPACNPFSLAKKIDEWRHSPRTSANEWQSRASFYTWDKIRKKYIDLWGDLL